MRISVTVLHYHGIRGSKLAIDAVDFGLFRASSLQSHEGAISSDEETKFEKYSKGVRSRHVTRFIPFAFTEFGALGDHTTAFYTEVARHAAASNEIHVGKLLASWRREVSLAVHVAHADIVLRGLSAAADDVEAASSSAGMPSPTTAFFTRAMGRKCLRAFSRGA
jgi:hypothetical protein